MPHEQLFHIGTKGILKNLEGKYLCVKSYKGYFDIPGGRIMAGEDVKMALSRELREELHIPSESYDIIEKSIPLPTNRFTQQDPVPVQLFILIYHCILKGDISILLNEENTAYSWETARDLYDKVTILQGIPFEEIFV